MRHFLLLAVLLFSAVSISFSQQTRFNGELIVQAREGADVKRTVSEYPSEMGLRMERVLSETMRAYHLSFDTLTNHHDEIRALLSRNPAFSIVQDNHRVWLREIPNDPSFGSQWHHRNTGQNGGTPDADIDSDEAWEHTTGGTTALGDEIVVCIIEGVNMNHPDLVANRWQNTHEIPGNGIDDDGNGYIDDIYGWNVAGNNGNVGTSGHGTNVAGMIGAKGNNGLGVAGVNWDVKIMVVSGHNANSEANIIAAYNYPLVQRKLYDQTNGEKGAFVVSTNASWGIDGGNSSSIPLWCAFYDTLGTYGILNCGATTNSNLNVDVADDIPTGCGSPYMIGVGRSDRNDGFAGGYGLNTIDLAAPGINVWTTDGNNGYAAVLGTSFASPLTAGAIALLYSVPCTGFAQTVRSNPHLGADIVRNALLNGVDVKPALQNFFITGGRLNVNNSMNILLEEHCSSCLSPMALDAEEVSDGDAELTWGRVDAAVSYTVFYREQGSDEWLSQTSSDTILTLAGLDNCATYEFYVESTCEEEFSNPSAIRTFSLLPYCGADATLAGADFNVLSPTSIAGTYPYQAPSGWGADFSSSSAYGQLVLADDGSANPTLGCNALVNAAAINGNIAVFDRGSCEFGVKAMNAQNAGAAAVIIINNVAGLMDMGAGNQGGNVNIPVIMVTQADGSTIKNQLNAGNAATALLGQRDEWVESVSVGSFSLTSGNDGGYAFHRQQGDIGLTQGQAYSVSVTPGATGGATLQHRVRVWLDADQDGTFSSAELLMDEVGMSGSPVSGSITIPADAQTGSTRLRVQTSGATPLPDVCGTVPLGETEDYCAFISDLTVGLEGRAATPLSVFPNPADGLVTVAGLATGQTVTVFSVDGRMMTELTSQGNSMTLDVGQWPRGAYLVRVLEDRQGLRHARIVVM